MCKIKDQMLHKTVPTSLFHLRSYTLLLIYPITPGLLSKIARHLLLASVQEVLKT